MANIFGNILKTGGPLDTMMYGSRGVRQKELDLLTQETNIDLAKQKQALERKQFKLLKKTSKKQSKMEIIKQLHQIVQDPRPPQYGGYSIEEKKAAREKALNMIMKRQGGMGQITGGWTGTPQAQPTGGAMAGLGGQSPKGLVREKVVIDTSQGWPATTTTYGQEFAKSSGAYKYIPEADRPEVARQALVKPGASVQVGVKMPPAGMLEKLSQFYEFESILGDISSLFASPGVADTVGAFSGRWENFKETYNIPFTEKATSDEVIFRQMTDMIADNLLRMRSGAAINEQEYRRLKKLMPDYKQKKSTFKPKWEGLMRAIKHTIEGKKRALREAGYIVPGETQLPGRKAKEKSIQDMSDEELRKIVEGK
jgi:hypothetical protein